MSYGLIVTFAILIGATVLFLSDRLRADLVAILVVLSLGLTGVLTPQEAFSGFSRSAVITILAIFILAEGLQRTGITEQAGSLLLRVAGTRESRLVAVTMLLGAMLSLFMNNIAAASVLLPAVSGAVRRAGAPPSRLLMPLAFGTILGGMATLFTSVNIVASGLLRDQRLAGFGVLDFAPVGLPIVAAGVAYMVLSGRRLLPRRVPKSPAGGPRAGDLALIYQLGERLFRAQVPAGSPVIGRSLAQTTFRETYGVDVLAVDRNGHTILSPPPDTILYEDDVLVLEGKIEEFGRQAATLPLDVLPIRPWHESDLESPRAIMAEAVLAPRSSLVGQTLRGIHFRQKYGMNVVAVWRAGRPIRTQLADRTLQFGDALLLYGPRDRLPILRSEPDLIVLEHAQAVPVPGRGWLALAIFAGTLIAAAFLPTLVAEVMLSGAVVMILAGILPMDRAYQAIDWRTLFIIAGMLPLGTAMTKTGAADLLAGKLMAVLGPAGHLALLAGLMGLTVLLTQAMNGVAVATIMVPIAIQAAGHAGLSPRSLVMGVALAASMAFITPLGHPVNVLVMAPGDYRFGDYVRVGLPLTLVLFVVLLLLLPVIWPL